MLGEFQQGHHYLATTAVFFPGGGRFLTAAVDNSARIWDVATGMQVQTLEGTGLSAAAAISPDGKRIATGSERRTARIWDTLGNRLAETPDLRAEVTAVAFSPDGRLLFTGDQNGWCRLWDASAAGQSGALKLLWEAQRHSRGVISVRFLPGGKRILTASSDRTVAQWDAAAGREIVPLALGHAAAVTAMAVSPDGRRALTVCEDGRVRLWDVESARQLGEFSVPGETITAVAFSPDGSSAVTTSTLAAESQNAATGKRGSRTAAEAESAVRLWDTATLKQLPGENDPVVAGGQKVAGDTVAPFHRFRETSALAWESVFSPDGASLLTAIGSEVRMMSVKARQETMAFIPQGAVASARFSPDGRRVVTSSWDNTARIWDIVPPFAEQRNRDTVRAEIKLIGHSGYVNDAVFSPGDGRYVATAGRDNQAILWDASSGKLLARFAGEDGHRGAVTSVAFDAASRRLVTASQDHTAKVWDVATRRVLVTLGGLPLASDNSTPAAAHSVRPHTHTVLSAQFSPDGSACSPRARTIGQSFGTRPPAFRCCSFKDTLPR